METEFDKLFAETCTISAYERIINNIGRYLYLFNKKCAKVNTNCDWETIPSCTLHKIVSRMSHKLDNYKHKHFKYLDAKLDYNEYETFDECGERRCFSYTSRLNHHIYESSVFKTTMEFHCSDTYFEIAKGENNEEEEKKEQRMISNEICFQITAFLEALLATFPEDRLFIEGNKKILEFIAIHQESLKPLIK